LLVLNKALSDKTLQNAQASIEQKIVIFNELRVAMRIACTGSEEGLNDEGDDDIENIEKRVKTFRHSEKLQALSANNIRYRNMIKQIDKYWEKLCAKQIQVDTPAGKIIIQPQRINNLMAQWFRFLKRDMQKKSGQHSPGKALIGMLADTALIRNLKNTDYMTILLKGKMSLAERFADIDAKEVLQEEQYRLLWEFGHDLVVLDLSSPGYDKRAIVIVAARGGLIATAGLACGHLRSKDLTTEARRKEREKTKRLKEKLER
jgi:hypothetical protein